MKEQIKQAKDWLCNTKVPVYVVILLVVIWILA
jgi:hypothetical protein